MNKKKLSGAANRKRKLEEKEKIANLPKIGKFFSKKEAGNLSFSEICI